MVARCLLAIFGLCSGNSMSSSPLVIPQQNADRTEILQWLEAEYARPFSGWDFSAVSGRRRKVGTESWNYDCLAAGYARSATAILDMPTGGGENFSRILDASAFRGRAVATEGRAPNVQVAADRLANYGAQVTAVADDAPLPFDDDAFDLICNRHGGGLDGPSLGRVLKPDGIFLCQQVGERTTRELEGLIGCPRTRFDAPGSSNGLATDLQNVGFEICRRGCCI
jgi:SAM-dependent methyltransferase